MVSIDWLLFVLQNHCIAIAVQKSCIHAYAVAVFEEWWIVVFVIYSVVPPRHLHLRCFIGIGVVAVRCQSMSSVQYACNSTRHLHLWSFITRAQYARGLCVCVRLYTYVYVCRQKTRLFTSHRLKISTKTHSLQLFH